MSLVMGCFSPLRVYELKGRTPKGARLLVFQPKPSSVVIDTLRVPCGRCDGCKYDYCRDWASRAELEFIVTRFSDDSGVPSVQRKGVFLTLTYSDENLPPGGSLVFKDLQLFFKRLRKAGVFFRYFACGEYGEKFLRPHYHACIFGYDFPDKVFWSKRRGRNVYKSALLEKVWTLGISEVMDFVPQAASYVAGYVLKKQGRILDFFRLGKFSPEFITMSRNPGLGTGFVERFGDDLSGDFFFDSLGNRRSLPRFVLSKLSESVSSDIKARRRADPLTGQVKPEVSQADLDVRAELFRARTRRAGQSRIFEEAL